MARFRPEPAFSHGAPARTGILLVNLGTPEAPTRAALRPYLKEFLTDPRVVEIPRALWWPILNGVILALRPGKSAQKYQLIWTPEGSPLKVHTERQAKLLRGALGEAGWPHTVVEYAMRYGRPSIASTLDRLKAAGCARILVLPLYPQYAASTTGSVADALAAWIPRVRNLPELRMVRGFHDDPGYIGALAATVRAHWAAYGRPDRLIMSFHGVPRSTLEQGDPYHCECRKTGRLLAEALGLAEDAWRITFQSRFGRAEWLQPYTQPTLEALARTGTKRADVVCPGFVADCLETLEEIALECKQAFLGAGGREYHYLPCLNEGDEWIRALAGIARSHLGGWLEQSRSTDDAVQTVARARALGAEK